MRALLTDTRPATFGSITLLPVTAERWRAIGAAGAIVGHVRSAETDLGSRFVAERWSPLAGAFRQLGSFWTLADAAACLRDGN